MTTTFRFLVALTSGAGEMAHDFMGLWKTIVRQSLPLVGKESQVYCKQKQTKKYVGGGGRGVNTRLYMLLRFFKLFAMVGKEELSISVVSS